MIRLQETAELFSDIYQARDAVFNLAKTVTFPNRISATLVFDANEYLLSKPLVFDANEFPELKNIDLTLTGNDGYPLFTSNIKLNPEKVQKSGDVCLYQFEKDDNGNYPHFRDLYGNGKRLSLCVSESFIHAFPFSEENGRINEANLEGIYIPKEIADTLPDGDLSPMEITLYVEWEFYILHVLGVDRSKTKTDEDGNTHVLLKIAPDELYNYVTSTNKCLQPRKRKCFLCNHPLFLKENTFCYHHKTGILAYRSEHAPSDITVPMLEALFVFSGMNGVTLKNLRFTGATDKVLCRDGYFSGQANVYIKKGKVYKHPEAAVLVRDGRRFTVTDCLFEELGVNGILMMGHPVRTRIQNNIFHHIAMSGISIGDPLKIFRAPQACSYDIHIENNKLGNIGYEFPSSPAIDIFRVDSVFICHNEIDKTAYSGISVGWEWATQKYALGEMVNIRDAEIAYNRITRFMQVLNDGGGIYVVGSNCYIENTRTFNFMHHNFVACEKIKRTVRGYYLDGASSNWSVYENVTSGVQRPVFAQFIVQAQFTWNNRLDETYTTEEIDPENHAPERNTLLGTSYFAPTLVELFEKYPKAKEIYEASGCEKQTISDEFDFE